MSMLNLPTDVLRSFIAVAETGGVTAAAAFVGRTQPAVTQQLQKLEEVTGAALFSRVGRRLALTEAGESLLGYARQMLLLNDEAVARLRAEDVSGAVRAGLPNDFAVSFLPEILGEFAAEHAGVRPEVACDLSVNLLAGLAKGRHDLVIALQPDTGAQGPGEEISTARVWSERLVWAAPRRYRPRPGVPVPLIVYPRGCLYRARITDALDRAGQPWRVVYESPSLEGLRAAVEAGLGVTAISENTMPRALHRPASGAGLPGLADVEVGLFYRRGRLPDAGLPLVNHVIQKLDAAHGS